MPTASKSHARSGGFVALDIIWIVLLIGVVVLLSVRGMGLVEKREKADRLERELVVIEEAVKQLAEKDDLAPGTEVRFAQYAPFLDKRAPKRLREKGEDPLGGSYGQQRVGQPARPSPETIKTLGTFWE